MKKRLISMALAVSMAVSIMPAPALATVGGGGTTLGDDAITLSDATGGTSSGTATPVSDLTGLTDAVRKGGNVQLSGNITLTDTLSINSKKLSIDLNGHTITAANNQRAFNISNGGTLEIKDSVGKGIIQGNGTVTGRGGAIYMEGSGSALTISGGTIQGFTVSAHGGGVYMSGGTFTMTGGKIYNCSSSDTHLSGGGVFMAEGTFDMCGGSIENCTAHEGAGVEVYPDSGNTCTFTMSGSAEIKNCSNDGVSVTSAAGGQKSEFIMNGGTIQGTKGRGVCAFEDNASITLNGGTIKYTDPENFNVDIRFGATLTVNNGVTVSGKVFNMRGTIQGDGTAQFTGTVENAGTGKIESGIFNRIEDRRQGGTFGNIQCDEFVYLISNGWPEFNSQPGSSFSLKFLSYVSAPTMTNTLTIPEGVTVTVDLTGKQVAGVNTEKKIINHGNLTLIDSGTGSTLSIPIENYGTLNANGGTVTGEVTNKGTITTTGEKATQFSGGVTNESDGKIENGTFSGEVTNNGAINDGTFSGKVTNNGTIGNGNFTGAVTNEKTGVISGGKFDESKLTNNGGTLPPKPGDNKPGDNKPDDTNKDNDKKEDTYDLTVKNAEVTVKDADGKAVEFTKAEDGTLTAKVPENAEVTVKYTAPTDAIVFDLWSINSDAKLDVNVKENPLTFKMPAQAVTIEAMTQDATIESEGPGVLGTAAMIGVAGAGTAVLGYTGYMIGTELYLNTVLPAGAAIPQNTTELAKLLWTEAGKPAPAAVMAEDATDEQKALTWAVESQLISADKPADASVGRWEVIRGWNRVKEMK